MIPPLSERAVLLLFCQISLLLLLARSLGEIFRRFDQPPVLGELLAGILLGPSVLGALLPGLEHVLFPPTAEQFHLLEALSWLGMVFLMLLTGIETDIRVLANLGRPAFAASLMGILIPFATGFALGWAIPDDMLAQPGQRLLFSLFLATAMSISAVPVIAKILIDLRLIRRDLGLVILGAGVTDDTIGWVLLSVITGIATKGGVSVGSVLGSVVSTALFIAACSLVGVRLVQGLLRWVDDHCRIEHAMVTAVVLVTLICASVTEWIGIHAVFGAFAAGIMISQSPRVRRDTVEKLEGLLLGVFAPLFFTYAGLKVDLMRDFSLGLAALILAVACFGKIVGCTMGAYWGGLGRWESLSVGFGMNARGAMGLVVAIVGLSLSLLSGPMYAAIVLMALFTSFMAPPLLRWSTTRVSPSAEEEARLRVQAERARSILPEEGVKILVPTAGGENAKFAIGFAAPFGRLAGSTITAVHFAAPDGRRQGWFTWRKTPIDTHFQELKRIASTQGVSNLVVRTAASSPTAAAILEEAGRGYDLLILGASRESRRRPLGGDFIRRVVDQASCHTLVVETSGPDERGGTAQVRRILVPITGTWYSRAAAEFVVLYARQVEAEVDVIYVSESAQQIFRRFVPEEEAKPEMEPLFQPVVAMAQRHGVRLRTTLLEGANAEKAILREVNRGHYNLLVLGAVPRPHATRLFLGRRVEILLKESRCAVAVFIPRMPT